MPLVEGSCGGPYISGWIIALFPYLDKQISNKYVWEKSWTDAKDHFGGISTSSLAYHMNQVPFKWIYYGQEKEMLFIGGLLGVVLHKDQALQPVFGYAVTENKIENNNFLKFLKTKEYLNYKSD